MWLRETHKNPVHDFLWVIISNKVTIMFQTHVRYASSMNGLSTRRSFYECLHRKIFNEMPSIPSASVHNFNHESHSKTHLTPQPPLISVSIGFKYNWKTLILAFLLKSRNTVIMKLRFPYFSWKKVVMRALVLSCHVTVIKAKLKYRPPSIWCQDTSWTS